MNPGLSVKKYSVCPLDRTLNLVNILWFIFNFYMLLSFIVECSVLKIKCGAFLIRLHRHQTNCVTLWYMRKIISDSFK